MLVILIIVLFFILIELLQILFARKKVLKWIQPFFWLFCSINLAIGIIVYKLNDASTIDKNILKILGMDDLFIFVIFNIPTIIFILTNIIIKNKDKKKNVYKD